MYLQIFKSATIPEDTRAAGDTGMHFKNYLMLV
jgi:hypothetical protein